MRAVLQRVSSASVTVADARIAAIDQSLLIFLGVAPADTDVDAQLPI